MAVAVKLLSHKPSDAAEAEKKFMEEAGNVWSVCKMSVIFFLC
jgi:hypothetical protein